MADIALVSGRWTRAERAQVMGIVAAIASLHVVGWSLFLFYSRSYFFDTS